MSEALPPILARIAELVGEAAALRLAREFGGVRTSVPRPDRIDPQHPIAQAIGLPKARLFAAEFGGGRLVIPLGPTAGAAERRRRAIDLARQGLSTRAVAQRVGMRQRSVEKLLARAGARRSDRQGDLFTDDRRRA